MTCCSVNHSYCAKCSWDNCLIYLWSSWGSLLYEWPRRWHNSQGGSAPLDISLGNFCWPTGKREGKKRGKMEKKRRKIEKGRWKIENGRRKVIKWWEDPLFFLSFLLFTFENHWKLFWVYQNCNFLLGKNISRQEKKNQNSGKITLPPLKNIPLMPLGRDQFILTSP